MSKKRLLRALLMGAFLQFGALAGVVRREAYVMAYGDCFYIIGALLLAMVMLVWMCRGAKGAAPAGH